MKTRQLCTLLLIYTGKHYTFPPHRLKGVQASLMGKFKGIISFIYLLYLID